ncbi:MAG: aminotransferase class V-fold PLP-dependent enzyme, partial [Myxococcota bacterium]
VFTSCATESNNAAVFGAVRARPDRRHVITTAVEHPAVMEPCKDLARQGYEVEFLPVDHHGRIEPADFVRALRPDTLLVSIMHGNNETGVVFPVGNLARITKETSPEIIFHTDATQTVGKLPIDLKEEFSHVDLLTFSGHKLHGPKGVGALFVRRGTPLRPLLLGGHQERGRRAGTENVAGIIGLGEACRVAAEHMGDYERVRALRDRLEQTLRDRIPWLEVNGSGAERLAGSLSLACHCIEGESILAQLDAAGICASSGSACTSGSLEPSHVLSAMKLPFTALHGSVRFSLSRYTTDEDVDRVIEVFPGVVESLRRMSPYWDREKQAPRADVLGAAEAPARTQSA